VGLSGTVTYTNYKNMKKYNKTKLIYSWTKTSRYCEGKVPYARTQQNDPGQPSVEITLSRVQHSFSIRLQFVFWRICRLPHITAHLEFNL